MLPLTRRAGLFISARHSAQCFIYAPMQSPFIMHSAAPASSFSASLGSFSRSIVTRFTSESSLAAASRAELSL